MKPTLPMLIGTLPKHQQRQYRNGMRWRILDGLLTGSAAVLGFGALLAHGYGLSAATLLPWLIGLSLALFLIRLKAGARAMQLAYGITYDGGVALRRQILRHLSRLPLGSFRKLHPGKVAQVLSEDVMWLENFTAFYLGGTRAETAALLMLMTATATLYWPAALAAVLFWAIGLLTLRRVSRSLSRGLRLRSDGITEAGHHFMEYAQGIQVIRAFGGSRNEDAEFARWAGIMRIGFRKGITRNAPMIGLIHGLSMAAVGTGTLVAVLTASADTAPMRVLAAVGLLTATLIPARTIITNGMIARLAAIGQDNASTLQALAPTPNGPQETSQGPCHLAFDRVSFAYGADQAGLQDISFAAAPGTITAIVGPSGAGKSTLASLLLRFHDVDDGRVTLNGQDIRNFAAASYMNRFAAVFQETHLFADSLRENIRIGRPDASEADVIAAAKSARIHDRIMAMPEGYDTVLGAGGGTLSGGERQRVSIARAILKDADVVILDEATSALDPENEREIQFAFEHLVRGKTVFIIAHRLSTITGADQILLLDQGRLSDIGTHAELSQRSTLYQRLWRGYEACQDWQL